MNAFSKKLRKIRHRELKAAIQAGIESKGAGLIRDVVARNRARRADLVAPKK